MSLLTAAASRLRPRGRLWSHSDFLKLWAGQSISSAGTGVTLIALPTVAVLQLHATPFQVGLLMALQRVPFPVFALLAGGVVDRVARKPLMIGADVGRMVALAVIPVTAAVGVLAMWQLFAVALAIGLFTVVFDISYLAYLPSFVGREDLVEANTKLEVTTIFEDIAGVGLGGVIIQLAGAARALAIDSASYFVSVASLISIRRAEPRSEPQPGRLLSQIRQGVAFVMSNRLLRSQLLLMSVMIAGAHAVEAVEFPFAYRLAHMTPATLGIALAMWGVGGIVGFTIAPGVLRRLGVGVGISLTFLAVSLTNFLLPLALVVSAFAVFATAGLIGGVMDTIGNIGQVSLRQSLTPDRLQGRMNATFRTFFWGAWPLGNFVGGIVGSAIGLVETIIVMSVIAVLASIALLASPLRTVKTMPEAAA